MQVYIWQTTQVHVRICLVHSNHSSIAENFLQKKNYVSWQGWVLLYAVCYSSQYYPPKETKLPSNAKIVRRIPRVYPGLSSGIFMPVSCPSLASMCGFSQEQHWCSTAAWANPPTLSAWTLSSGEIVCVYEVGHDCVHMALSTSSLDGLFPNFHLMLTFIFVDILGELHRSSITTRVQVHISV